MQWSAVATILVCMSTHVCIAEQKEPSQHDQQVVEEKASDSSTRSIFFRDEVLSDDMFDQMSDTLAQPRRWPTPIEAIIQKIKRPGLIFLLWAHATKRRIRDWCARQYAHYVNFQWIFNEQSS